MIKPQDLRIGNTLNYTTSEGDVLPTTLDWQDLKWISEDPKGFNLVHDGIPLTLEWLTRFVFKPNADMPWLMENGALMCNTGNHWIWHWSGRAIKDIKYVHELQNVMFALSGRELEVKPLTEHK